MKTRLLGFSAGIVVFIVLSVFVPLINEKLALMLIGALLWQGVRSGIGASIGEIWRSVIKAKRKH